MSCQVDKGKKMLFVLHSNYFLKAFEEIVSSIILITKKLIIAFESLKRVQRAAYVHQALISPRVVYLQCGYILG